MKLENRPWRVWTALSGVVLLAVVLAMRPAFGHSLLTALTRMVLSDDGSSGLQEQSPLPPVVEVAGPRAAGGVQLTGLSARYSKTDLVLQTSIGPFALTRTFQTVPGVFFMPWETYQTNVQWFWQGLVGYAWFDATWEGADFFPYGCGPPGCIPQLIRHADYVIQDPDTGTRTTFYTTQFDGGYPWPVNGYQVAADTGNPARLYVSTDGHGRILQYELIKPDVHYYFDGGTRGYLVRVDDPQNRTLAFISPINEQTISSITTIDDTLITFDNFSNGLTYSISITPPGGTLSQVATYSESGNLYTQVVYPSTGTGESYAYGTYQGLFTVSTLTGEQVISYVVDAGRPNQGGANGLVTQQTTEETTLTIAGPTPINCPQGVWYCSNITFTDNNEYSGNGNRTPTTLNTTYMVTAPDGGVNSTVNGQQQTGAVTKSYSGNSPTATWQYYPGFVRVVPDSGTAAIPSPGSPPIAQWSVSPNGAYTVYADGGLTTAIPSDAGFDLPVEYPSIAGGAGNSSGAGALEDGTRTYVYGANYQQFISSVTQASPLGGSTTTYYNWDLTKNRLKSVVRVGTTVVDSSFATVPAQSIGTLYTYTDELSIQGPPGRLAEIDGPCFVTSTKPTACATSSYPRTTYGYYAPSSGANSDQLNTKTICTSVGCTGAGALTTTYGNYDSRGRPTTISDTNQVTTKYTYHGTHLIEKDVSPASGSPVDKTLYTYDGDRLLVTEEPSGMYDVTCRRTGTSDTSCSTGGTPSKFVWWKARCSTPTCTAGTVISKIVYDYAHGNLLSETYYDSSGTIRRMVRHESDPLNRLTFTAIGNGTDASDTAHAAFAAFDSDSNQIAAAFPYNASAPFCLRDNTCSGMTHDGLDRIRILSEPIVNGQASLETISYDTIGRVSSIAYGDLAVMYKYDDFGNLISVAAPWHLGGQIQYAYDGQGHIIYKRTPSMAVGEYLQYTYDMVGRPASLLHYLAGFATLWAVSYDTSTPVPPSNCPAPGASSFTNGRVQFRTDSFGQTWYTYNFRGQVVGESRIRAGATSCTPLVFGFCQAQGNETNPNTSYSYSPSGQLTQINYPHGRSVVFSYLSGGDKELVSSVAVGLNVAGAWSGNTLLSNITWEPYGGIRGYEIDAPSNVSTSAKVSVEYLLGDTSTVASMASCPGSRPSSAASDQSGRLRALWVSTGPYNSSSPTGTGDIFARQYTWQGDQLVSQASCLLQASGIPLTENFSSSSGALGYDTRMRLQHSSRPPLGKRNTGGSWGQRDYSYTPRGARNSETTDCWSWTNVVSDATDQLTSRTINPGNTCTVSCVGTPTFANTSYTYDADGRVSTISSPSDSVGPAMSLSLDAGVDGQAAIGSVYKGITVNDGAAALTYEYWYDASGRRRLKVFPDGEMDEYFYDLNDHFLEDHENCTGCNPNTNTLDEYVWLGGRPVILLRGSVNASGVLNPDFSGTCADLGTCGVYFPVTDYLGKPVVLLDSSLLVAGAADYDPFGHVNRVIGLGDTLHHYIASPVNPQSGAPEAQVIAGFRQAVPAGAAYSIIARARLLMVDTDSVGTAYASLTDLGVTPLQKYPSGTVSNVGGPHFGATVTDWAFVPNGSSASPWQFQVRFTAASSSTRSGVAVGGYEYRKYQTGSTPAWLPLRFPGQYYDSETDLYQNWNRFYDAATGRYLEADPVWLYPERLVALAARGLAAPVYAYAANNPIGRGDPRGLLSRCLFGSCIGDDLDGIGSVSDNGDGENLLLAQVFPSNCPGPGCSVPPRGSDMDGDFMKSMTPQGFSTSTEYSVIAGTTGVTLGVDLNLIGDRSLLNAFITDPNFVYGIMAGMSQNLNYTYGEPTGASTTWAAVLLGYGGGFSYTDSSFTFSLSVPLEIPGPMFFPRSGAAVYQTQPLDLPPPFGP